MMGDYHVRFRERFRGETPLYLLDSHLQMIALAPILEYIVNKITILVSTVTIPHT